MDVRRPVTDVSRLGMSSESRLRCSFFKGDFDVGLMARSERLFYLVITMMIANFYGYANEFLFTYMLLVLITALFRYFKIAKLIKVCEKEN